jgi:hypothetical protein
MACMTTILYRALRARSSKPQVTARAAQHHTVIQVVGIGAPSSAGRAVQPKYRAQPAGRSVPAVQPRRYGIALHWRCTDDGRVEACWLPTTQGAAQHALDSSGTHEDHTRRPGHE